MLSIVVHFFPRNIAIVTMEPPRHQLQRVQTHLQQRAIRAVHLGDVEISVEPSDPPVKHQKMAGTPGRKFREPSMAGCLPGCLRIIPIFFWPFFMTLLRQDDGLRSYLTKDLGNEIAGRVYQLQPLDPPSSRTYWEISFIRRIIVEPTDFFHMFELYRNQWMS